MRKFYVLNIILSMMILCSTSVRAQVASMADLFGKYQFTADVEVTEAGKASEANFVKEGEVVITKDAINVYDAQITGFAVNNATEALKVNAINTETCKFKVTNPNGQGSTMGSLSYSDVTGKYPYGRDGLDPLIFEYDPNTKSMTTNDFTLVGNVNNASQTCDVFAKFTNVKLTLIEAEAINIPDISGNWKVTGGGAWGTKEESVLPTEYSISLVQGATPKDYEATITIEGIAPFTLAATFDGNTLAIPFDNVLIDEANGYYLATMNKELTGKFTFNYSSEKAMPSGSALVIVKKTDNEETPYEAVQWWMDGSAKKQADAPEFSWAGTFKMTVANLLDFTGGVDSFPAESDFEITYYEAIDAYYLTSILGCNVGNVNNGGLKLTISDEDPTVAEISLTGPYGAAYLKSSDDNSVWYKMVDANGGQTPLTLKRNDDGTFTLSNFFIVKGAYGDEKAYVASVQDITIQGEAPVVLTWEGSYEATATVTKYVDGDYPETFPIVIAPEGDYGQFITTFITEDAYAANYGGIRFTPSEEDENKAEMASDKFVKTVEPGVAYWKIYDVNGSNSPISITRNEDGSLSIGSFSLFEISYDAEWNEVKKCLAMYENVVAKQTTTGINSANASVGNAEGMRMFDLSGRSIKSAGNGRLVIIKTADGVKKVFVK